MMKYQNLWMSFFATALLCSCGGGGSGDSAGIDASGSPIASQGTIDGFGSVIVNGIRFKSDKATVFINGQSATEDDLDVGFQVWVTGSVDANNVATADTIEYFPELMGEITEIDQDAEQLTVLGRQILINNRTIFGNNITPNNLQGLSLGNRVKVSGKTDLQGRLVATHIELSSDLVQLRGVVSNINRSNQTFSLEGTLVNYAGATLVNISQLDNNLRVSVRGTQDTNGTIQAQQIFNAQIALGSTIKKAEIEGRITRFVSATDFDVDGILCTTTTQTLYESGSLSNLVFGAELELKGSVNANGSITAERIEFEQEDKNQIQGLVTTITLSSTDSIVTGSLTVGNILIKTTQSTRYEDKSNDDERRFNLASIDPGNYLEVTGYNQNSDFIATKIERREIESDDDDEFEMEGSVSAVGSNSITLLGQVIQLNDSTEIKTTSGVIDLADFLLIALNQQVDVEGTITEGVYTASHLEIQDDNDDDDDD